jgi:hypothetical protein
MVYSITNENLIIVEGGHAQPGLGSQRHLPIFKGNDGAEYVSLNGQTLTKVETLRLNKYSRRETVQR